MNLDQRIRVKQLRNDGFGYNVIAKQLEISVNTVKSFCQRNGLGQKKINNPESLCDYCDAPIVQIKSRKKKRFCRDKCRNNWWKAHQNQIKKSAYYEMVCCHCNQKFESYGNRYRKYCCHSCYISDRFGGNPHAN